MSTKSYSKSSSGSSLRKRRLKPYLRWAKWVSLLIFILVMMLLLKIGWEHAKSWSFFKITEIEISGNQRASKEEILLLSGLKPGMGIFNFKLSEAVNGIQSHPWVKEARVSRQLPDRVLIFIREKEPSAILVSGEVYYLDSEWKVFKKLLPGDKLDYPVFTGLTLEDLQDKSSQKLALAKGALELWELAKVSSIFPSEQISEFHLEESTGLSLILRSGQKIILGEGDFAEKFHKLELMRVEMGRDFYLFRDLDLTRLDRVVARFFTLKGTNGTEAELE